MKKILSIISIFLALVILTGVGNATVTRSLDKSILSEDDFVKVTLNSDSGTDFQFGLVKETISNQFTIENPTTYDDDKVSIKIDSTTVDGDNVIYTFIGMQLNGMQYELHPIDSPTPATYTISGNYIDANKLNGNIGISTLYLCGEDDLLCIYDTNHDGSFSKPEVINAVAVYFTTDNLTLDDIVFIIKIYLGD